MDKDRIDGAIKQNTDAIKQATGALFCNTTLAAGGNSKKNDGRHQMAAGQTKDAKK